MYAVEIRLSDDRLLIDCMTNAAQWLGSRRISPATFRYIFEPPGVVYRVEFEQAAEAAAFVAEFPAVPAASAAGDTARR